jgi:hypothetical protein
MVGAVARGSSQRAQALNQFALVLVLIALATVAALIALDGGVANTLRVMTR